MRRWLLLAAVSVSKAANIWEQPFLWNFPWWMKCTQKAEKKLFGRGLVYGWRKRASVRNIVISVLLIVVGIAMLMLVTEGIKSGWYDAHSARPAKRKGYAALLPVLLVLLGGFNLYRGLRGKAFQMDISSMFSGHRTEVRLPVRIAARSCSRGSFPAKSVAEGFPEVF